jgi:hypothetical protein
MLPAAAQNHQNVPDQDNKTHLIGARQHHDPSHTARCFQAGHSVLREKVLSQQDRLLLVHRGLQKRAGGGSG